MISNWKKPFGLLVYMKNIFKVQSYMATGCIVVGPTAESFKLVTL